MVAGNVGGIPLQVDDGVSGYLINSVEECADRVTELLQQPEVAERMGIAGREHVRKNFLITRYLRDYLQIFHDQAAGQRYPSSRRDPQPAAAATTARAGLS